MKKENTAVISAKGLFIGLILGSFFSANQVLADDRNEKDNENGWVHPFLDLRNQVDWEAKAKPNKGARRSRIPVYVDVEDGISNWKDTVLLSEIWIEEATPSQKIYFKSQGTLLFSMLPVPVGVNPTAEVLLKIPMFFTALSLFFKNDRRYTLQLYREQGLEPLKLSTATEKWIRQLGGNGTMSDTQGEKNPFWHVNSNHQVEFLGKVKHLEMVGSLGFFDGEIKFYSEKIDVVFKDIQNSSSSKRVPIRELKRGWTYLASAPGLYYIRSQNRRIPLAWLGESKSREQIFTTYQDLLGKTGAPHLYAIRPEVLYFDERRERFYNTWQSLDPWQFPQQSLPEIDLPGVRALGKLKLTQPFPSEERIKKRLAKNFIITQKSFHQDSRSPNTCTRMFREVANFFY